MNVRYIVELTDDEHQQLDALTRRGKTSARKVRRAQILLAAHDGVSDKEVVKRLNTCTSTVYRTKRKYVEEGLESALAERRRVGAERKLDAKQEATLVAMACSEPPEGRSRWTLQLLADHLVVATELESVSIETVRRRLKEKELKPWQKKMWCIPKVNADFVAQMEHVLDLYAEPADPRRPVVNFDEAFKQLVCDTRVPIPAAPGRIQRYDYEYKRAGTANIFLFFDRHQGWRKAKATKHKRNADFAECMRDLVDIHYPEADTIRVVLDNLSTHRPGALYKTLPADEARRVLRRIEFHYTPKHASWLNMVEIEIGIMNRQCLDRRIPDLVTLERELAAWESDRNDEQATINWLFNIKTARRKLGRAYPEINRSESL
jgi:transposase